jgi:hypothetical protein
VVSTKFMTKTFTTGPSLVRPNPLLQKVGAFQQHALLRLFTTAVPAQLKAPGMWMHDALAVRDEWTSRLLRTSRWSPLA